MTPPTWLCAWKASQGSAPATPTPLPRGTPVPPSSWVGGRRSGLLRSPGSATGSSHLSRSLPPWHPCLDPPSDGVLTTQERFPGLHGRSSGWDRGSNEGEGEMSGSSCWHWDSRSSVTTG